MSLISASRRSAIRALVSVRMYSSETSRGGGGAGAIRDAGGAFGKREAAMEEQYFHKKQTEQLHELKKHVDKEVAFHQEQIKRHEDAIRRHKELADQIEKKMYSGAGQPGSGAGKGGGGGGSIREAGGAFGKMEAGREEEYFHRKQMEQIQNLKKHLDKEIAFHQDQIKLHEDAIRRHKELECKIVKK